MPLDLTSNLISEAIGILFTALFVDQLIIWREKKKWVKVKSTFTFYARRYINTIIEKWEEWLSALPKVTEKDISEYRKHELRYLKENNYYEFVPAHDNILNDVKLVEKNLGYPYGSKLKSFIENEARYKINKSDIIKAILIFRPIKNVTVFGEEVGTLFSILYSSNVPANNLRNPDILKIKEELMPIVEKLSNLVDRYPTIIDEKISLKIMSLSLLIEDLPTDSDSEKGYLKKQFCLQYCLMSSIDLKSHINKLMGNLNYHYLLPFSGYDAKTKFISNIRLIATLIFTLIIIAYTLYTIFKNL